MGRKNVLLSNPSIVVVSWTVRLAEASSGQGRTWRPSQS